MGYYREITVYYSFEEVFLLELSFLSYFQAIFVDLQPDPIKILSIAKIVRSPSQQDKGPWFYVDARKTPVFIEVS